MPVVELEGHLAEQAPQHDCAARLAPGHAAVGGQWQPARRRCRESGAAPAPACGAGAAAHGYASSTISLSMYGVRTSAAIGPRPACRTGATGFPRRPHASPDEPCVACCSATTASITWRRTSGSSNSLRGPIALERRHAAKNFAAEVSGQPDRGQLPRLLRSDRLVRTKRSGAPVGQVHGLVELLGEVRQEIIADAQRAVRDATQTPPRVAPDRQIEQSITPPRPRRCRQTAVLAAAAGTP